MPRRARVLVVFTAACLAMGGILHLGAFAKAAATIGNSALPTLYISICKSLWVGNGLTNIALAVVFASIAAHPRLARPSLIALLACVPLAGAATLFSMMGGFFAAYVMLGAGLSALAGALLSRERRE